MQFLVTMTTHVPAGTPASAVEDIRHREAAHSRELADQGHLLRLWRPPLQPGEWRSLGLFDAAGEAELEEVLASMPLRVWRTDEVTPLAAHPNDPLPEAGTTTSPGRSDGSEYLVSLVLTIPDGTPRESIDAHNAREAVSAREHARDGQLIRLWKLPAEGSALGLYRAHDIAEMDSLIAALPLVDWLAVQITPLSPHPSDPAAHRSSTTSLVGRVQHSSTSPGSGSVSGAGW